MMIRKLTLATGFSLVWLIFSLSVQAEEMRQLGIDLNGPSTPRDHFVDLAVGSDYPGTLIREDSLAQLKIVREELGFRYIRFHAIFHDGSLKKLTLTITDFDIS